MKHTHHETADHESPDTKNHSQQDDAKIYITHFFIVSAVLLPLVFISGVLDRFISVPRVPFQDVFKLLLTSVIFYYAGIFFSHAKHEIKTKNYGMMTLVSLALFAGFIFSVVSMIVPEIGKDYYLELSTLVWVLLFGHYIEARSRLAAGDALEKVRELLPEKAHRVEGEKVVDVDVSKLQKHDVVFIKPGERVPADGVIREGEADFDEAHITGESVPIRKGSGADVFAGSICMNTSVKVELLFVGDDSTVGKIHRLITRAKKTRPQVQFLAEKSAKILTFVSLGVSVFTVIVWSGFFARPLLFSLPLAISVLVITCPHALGLAIPVVSAVTTSLSVKYGLFIKDVKKLEVVKNIDYVVFDKTGTLTKGTFGVVDVISFLKLKKDYYTTIKVSRSLRLSSLQKKLFSIAASLEKHSTHIIAEAMSSYAEKRKIPLHRVTSFHDFPGKGVTGKIGTSAYWVGNKQLLEENGLWKKEYDGIHEEVTRGGKTLVYIAGEKKILGLITLSDQIKAESRRTISSLTSLGVKSAMITGDSEGVASSVSRELGIDQYFARVLPEKKYLHVKSLQDQGYTVMMVGDGVNDAPALVQADIGVVIGAGTDIALDSGDVILTHNNPEDVARLIMLSRIVYRKMVENLVWAFGYNVIAIPVAAGA